MTIKEATQSKKIKIAAGIIGIILIALVSFGAGIRVGFRKARFSYAFGENYERNFAGPRPPMGPAGNPMRFFRDMEGRGFRNAHGLAGTIISIANDSVIIEDKSGKENTVTITSKTIIKQRRDNLKITDLKPDDQVVIMGNPDNTGTINATLIRVFDNDKKQN